MRARISEAGYRSRAVRVAVWPLKFAGGLNSFRLCRAYRWETENFSFRAILYSDWEKEKGGEKVLSAIRFRYSGQSRRLLFFNTP